MTQSRAAPPQHTAAAAAAAAAIAAAIGDADADAAAAAAAVAYVEVLEDREVDRGGRNKRSSAAESERPASHARTRRHAPRWWWWWWWRRRRRLRHTGGADHAGAGVVCGRGRLRPSLPRG